MIADPIDKLLADLIAPPGNAFMVRASAKVAIAANRDDWRGAATDPALCEGLRKSANPDGDDALAGANSQEFAALRSPVDRVQSEQRRGPSQVSQDSQGWPSACATVEALDFAAVAWTHADIARFLDRRARLMRWGW